jgi:hypothetical protein
MKTQMIKRTLLIAAAGIFVWVARKAPAQDAAGAVPSPMTYGMEQILKLEQARVGDATVIAYINNSPTGYGLNAEQIIYLRQQGVSDAVLTAMLTQSRAPIAPADASQFAPTPPPADTESAPVAEPSIVNTPTAPPSVTYVQTVPTPDYSYYYPSYSYYGWPFGWCWWGGAWHVGWGWHGGGGWNTGWHGGWGGGWHGGSGWHAGGGWHSSGGGHGGGGWHR